MREDTAIYPGTFDPITNGHLSIINRGLKIFDRLIVAILNNPNKIPLFSLDERLCMIKDVLHSEDRVEVDAFDGLLVDYAVSKKVAVVLRGMRAMSDFETEFQMALINRRLDRNIETVFLMTGSRWFYTNSSIIKEAASMGGTVRGLVPDSVFQKLREKYPKLKNNS